MNPSEFASSGDNEENQKAKDSNNAALERSRPTLVRVGVYAGVVLMASSLVVIVLSLGVLRSSVNSLSVIVAASILLMGMFATMFSPLLLREVDMSTNGSKMAMQGDHGAGDERTGPGGGFEATANGVKNRLLNEIQYLRGRARQALITGIATSAVGVTAVFVLVFNATRGLVQDAPTLYLLEMLPRLGGIAIVEALSFFFLRVYRDCLELSRYYQNEITTACLRLSSARAAVDCDARTRRQILSSLARTERNARLGNGESTEDIERLKAILDAQQRTASVMDRWSSRYMAAMLRHPSDGNDGSRER